MIEIRRLAVFCGSNPGTRPDYVQAARTLGTLLAQRGIGVVYGGSSVGLMAALADGFIALPGGIGTLEEFFETWTWAQLGMHAKPCGLLNVEGYYDGMLQFLDHAVAERFVRDVHRAMVIVESDPEKLLSRFMSYEPPRVVKWINAGTI